MAEEIKPERRSSSGGDSSLRDVASLLKDYVSKAEHETALETLNETMTELEKAKATLAKYGDSPDKTLKRLAELEGKVRTRNHKDAYEKLVDELKINPEFKDDVFELAKLTIEGDEPDVKAMKKSLAAFLEERPRYIALQSEEGEQVEATKVAKPKLHTEEEGRGTASSPGPKFRFKSSDLGDQAWMAKNADAYAAAVAAGTAVNVG